MLKSLLFIILTVLVSGQLVTAKPTDEVPVFECEVIGQVQCIFNNVVLTREQPNFVARSVVPNAIRSVEFKNSVIPVLSNDLCDAFRNVELLLLDNLQIETIADDAFAMCKQLRQLLLSENRIEELPKGLFGYNEKLSGVYLDSNRLLSIREDQFWNNTELYFLFLQDNHLTFFPTESLKNSPRLLSLTLHTNDLSDLKEREILATFPRLIYIAFNNNELACARLSDIMNEFSSRGVQIFKDEMPRERFYETLEINDITCLPDASWTAAFYRKLNQVPESFPKTVLDHLEKLASQFSSKKSNLKEVESRLEGEIEELENFVAKEVGEMKNLIMKLAKEKLLRN